MTDEIKGDKKEGVSILTHPLNMVVSNEKVEALSLYISTESTNDGHTSDVYQGCTKRIA